MTYHLLRMPLGVSTGTADPISPEELASAGLKPSDLPLPTGRRRRADGKQYAVPLDIHSIILYYNKDLLKKAGLLGDDGKPKGLDGAANFDAAVAKLTTKGVRWLSVPDDGGDRVAHLLHPAQPAGRRSSSRTASSLRRQSREGDDRARRNAELDQERLGAGEHRISGLDRPLHRRARPQCISTASGKSRRWLTSPRRVSCSTGARSRSRPSTSIPPPGRTRHSLAIPTARATRCRPSKRKLVLDTIHWFERPFDRMGRRRPYPGLSARCRTSQAFKDAEAELRVFVAGQDRSVRSGVGSRGRGFAGLRCGRQLHHAGDEGEMVPPTPPSRCATTSGPGQVELRHKPGGVGWS